jgi:transposase
MATKELFTVALGLQNPWFVKDISFNSENKRLDLFIDFKTGSRFECPKCNQTNCIVHDTRTRTWRHLDFFQHQAFLTARIPRVSCSECGVKQVIAPWAREGSGFTISFEIFLLQLAQAMPIKPLAELVNIHPYSIWNIVGHYVQEAHDKIDLTDLKQIGVDECSKEKGHKYFTVFGDLAKSRVIFITEDREAESLKLFHNFLMDKKIKPKQIEEFCSDMWPAYIKGIATNFPNASVTFDRFHLMIHMNKALDKVRIEEVKERTELKSTKYIWLKNKKNLTEKQKSRFNTLKDLKLKTVRAYQIKATLQELWKCTNRDEAELFLKKWYFWATHSRLEPIKEFAKTVKNHWNGILNFFNSKVTNGIIEGLNSKIKTAMKRAYGFKSMVYLTTIIYLIAGKLALPTQL